MSYINGKLPVWRMSVVTFSLLLFFFAIPHTLEDFSLGEPAENGVPATVLAFVVAGLFALQGLALFWAGRGNQRGYFVHAGLGLVWTLAAGIAQLPVILSSSEYRSGFISILWVAGMVVTGTLLFLASIQALKGERQAKNDSLPGSTLRAGGEGP